MCLKEKGNLGTIVFQILKIEFNPFFMIDSTAKFVEKETMRNCCSFVMVVIKAVTPTATDPRSAPSQMGIGFVLPA